MLQNFPDSTRKLSARSLTIARALPSRAKEKQQQIDGDQALSNMSLVPLLPNQMANRTAKQPRNRIYRERRVPAIYILSLTTAL
jgi:hypothetical protein